MHVQEKCQRIILLSLSQLVNVSGLLRSIHIESLDVNSSVEAQLFVTSLLQSQSLGVNGPLMF